MTFIFFEYILVHGKYHHSHLSLTRSFYLNTKEPPSVMATLQRVRCKNFVLLDSTFKNAELLSGFEAILLLSSCDFVPPPSPLVSSSSGSLPEGQYFSCPHVFIHVWMSTVHVLQRRCENTQQECRRTFCHINPSATRESSAFQSCCSRWRSIQTKIRL